MCCERPGGGAAKRRRIPGGETAGFMNRRQDQTNKSVTAGCGAGLLLCVCICLLHAAAGRADTIVFDSEERLTGTLVRIEGGRIVFKSNIAGEVTADLARVTSLTTDTAIDVGLDNGTALTGSAFGCRQGRLFVRLPGARPAESPGAPLPRLRYPARRRPFWSGSITAGLTSTHGNSFSQSANVSFKAVWRAEKHRLRLSGRYLASREEVEDAGGRSRKRTTEENFKLAAKYDYFFKKKVYGYLSGSYEKDHIADLDYRLLTGTGLGYQWAESDLFKLATDAGLVLVHEQFTSRAWDRVLVAVNPDTGAPTYAEAARSEETRNTSLALQLGWDVEWKLNSKMALQVSGTMNPSLDNPADYYLTNDAELRLSLTPLMYTSFKVLFDYDATPGSGARSTDTKYIMGLGISF